MPQIRVWPAVLGSNAFYSCLARASNILWRHASHVLVLNCDMAVLDGEAETLKKNKDGTVFYRDLRSPVAEYVHAIKS